MTLNRRDFLARAGGLAALSVVGVAGPAFGAAGVDPALARRNRLVVVFLEGGNDGLNMVVPRGDVGGAARLSVYKKVRPALAYAPGRLLPLDGAGDADQMIGFNPRLGNLHKLYKQGRVAVVQGVDYPNHNYSHFASADIWHSGDPTTKSAGWIGRHLDRAGIGDGELRAVAVGSQLPLMLQGKGTPAAVMTSIAAMRFGDGVSAAARTRHDALAALGAARAGDPLRAYAGATLRQTVDIVDELAKVTVPAAAGSPIAASLQTARTLLEQNLGVECVYVSQGGYDTHTTQVTAQEALFADLDTALAAFFSGLRADVADRTLVMVVSEFGRRIGESGAGVVAGTDHGAAAPVLLIGPPAAGANGARLVAGLHGDHPNMGTVKAPADNLAMTTDVRHLYQAVLQSWLGNPDPRYADAESTGMKSLFTETRATSSGVSAVGGKRQARDAAAGDATTTSSTPAPRNGRLEVSSRRLERDAAGATRDAAGARVHPVTLAGALAFNAFAAAVVLRSGRFRDAVATARNRSGLS